MIVAWAFLVFGVLAIVVIGWLFIIWAHFGVFSGRGRH